MDDNVTHLYCPYCIHYQDWEAKSHTAVCGKNTTGPLYVITEDSLVCAVCVDIAAQRHEGTIPLIQCIDCGMRW